MTGPEPTNPGEDQGWNVDTIQAAHIEVIRTARYFTLGPGSMEKELVLAVHGYAQSAKTFLEEIHPCVQSYQRVLAPEGLSRFYRRGVQGDVVASWMTREDRMAEIDDHCRYLDQLLNQHGSRGYPLPVRVLGFSQGVATVTRWLSRQVSPVQQLILWAGTLPQDGTMDLLRDRNIGRIDLVYGDQDPIVSPAQNDFLQRLLTGAKVEVYTHFFHGGHHLDPVLLRSLLEI